MKKRLLIVTATGLMLMAAAVGVAAGLSYPGKLGTHRAAVLARRPLHTQMTACADNKYGAYDPTTFPGVGKVRAYNLPVRTSGYVPRCLVAESVPGFVQESMQTNHRMPKTEWVHGASWDAGTWRISYRFHKTRGGGYMMMVARQGVRRVTANLYS